LLHIPTFWKKNELSYLKGSHILHEIKSRLVQTKREYKLLKENFIDFNIFSFYEYQRVRSLVSSRNFRLYIDGKTSTTLVPLADMLNHSLDAKTTWTYNNSKNGYEMTLKRDVRSGEEITDSYGRKDNHKYFLYYGFVMDEAPTKIYVKTRSFSSYLNDDFESTEMKNLLNYLRRLFLEPEQKFRYGFIDLYNEKKTIKELNKIMKRKKKSIPRTLGYYKKYKNSGSLNRRNAYKLIYMELSIIESYIKKTEIIMKYLRGNKVKHNYEDVKRYLTSVDLS